MPVQPWSDKDWEAWTAMFWRRHAVHPMRRQLGSPSCEHKQGRELYQVGNGVMYCQACWEEFFKTQRGNRCPNPERASRGTAAQQVGRKAAKFTPELAPPPPMLCSHAGCGNSVEEDCECPGTFCPEHCCAESCPAHGAGGGPLGKEPELQFLFADRNWNNGGAGEAGHD
jgi:hypothetical protein